MKERKPLNTDELLFVGKKEDLISAQRTVVSLQGRDVLIIYHEGEFYAIDSYCYHSGSSLETGDIEELNNKLCIICPKHKYKISLCDGEGLYRARDRSQSPPPLRWFSKGVKQRVHPIIEIQGELYLRPATSGYIESDYYQDVFCFIHKCLTHKPCIFRLCSFLKLKTLIVNTRSAPLCF
uniref:Rieske domain-containing protein n=1 Tax=Periophthalmus magnuspinnatus TaxID=409849 RepID=A0A3B4AI05_9GOBI